MDQPSLFDDDSARDQVGKWQRRGQSETSHEAAVEQKPLTGRDRLRVLHFLQANGEHGATDEEMQRALEMNPSTQRPRRVELVEKGLVEDSGRKRLTRAGRSAVVWVAVDRGVGVPAVLAPLVRTAEVEA